MVFWNPGGIVLAVTHRLVCEMLYLREITMVYKYFYKTPAGFSDILMNSDGEYLTGLWFLGSRDESKHVTNCEERLLPVFNDTIWWLNQYFSGNLPDFMPKYRINGLTDFRKEVVDQMLRIPYGEVVTYGNIAEILAKKRKGRKMSARAVGGAVGWNPICIIIPCHRVVGKNHFLTGYGGGLENKKALLALEGHNLDEFSTKI